MSCDVYGRLIIGIEANWDDFWRNITTGLFKCPNGHPRSNDSFKNCPECGGKFAVEITEHPTNPFRAYCAKQGKEPEQVWEDWRDSWRVGEIGLHTAAAVTSSEDDEPMRVFGKMVADTDNALEGGGGEKSFTPKEIADECAAIGAFAAEVGLTGPVKVYLSCYVSV